MSTPMDIAAMLRGVKIKESTEEWFTVARFINHVVIFLKQKLRANDEDDKAVYLQEWAEFFSNVVSLKDFQSGLSWKDVKHFLYGNVTKYSEFIFKMMIKFIHILFKGQNLWNNP